MSTRSTAIDRVLQFYRTASADTVRVTHALAVEVMAERKIGDKPSAKVARRRKQPKVAQTEVAAAAASSSGGN